MPRISLWIRNGDWEAFQKLKDRPGFVHAVLEQLKKKQVEDELKTQPHYTPPENVA